MNPSQGLGASRGQFSAQVSQCLPAALGDITQHSRRGQQSLAGPQSPGLGQVGSPREWLRASPPTPGRWGHPAP